MGNWRKVCSASGNLFHILPSICHFGESPSLVSLDTRTVLVVLIPVTFNADYFNFCVFLFLASSFVDLALGVKETCVICCLII